VSLCPSPKGKEPASDHALPDKECVACGARIPQSARICSTCKSYQKEWRNTLTFGASIAGFLVVLASLITFIYTSVTAAIKEGHWEDKVTVPFLKYPGSAIFENSGDGPIFVSMLEFHWPNEIANKQITISKFLGKGDIGEVILDYLEDRSPINRNITTADILKNFTWLADSTGIPPSKVVSESEPRNGGRCVIFAFLTADNPEILRVNRYYRDNAAGQLEVMPVEANVYWSSAHTGKLNRTPLDNIVMAFMLDPEAGCNEADWNGDQ